ncbi:hypothetical protein [Coprobacter tertius]|uniref:Phosphate-selective porin O and P n=1 Tax=Coprobacter tertius TaxID=2944915 RepID=A0ABT1MDR5_9BACT|nr:hypothetical protein [Coprobacter tertius]MCP9610767.1 hypothetical protein [Coprobacter tertius]
MRRYIYITVFLLTLPFGKIGAQDLLWNVDFTGFFDNREYKFSKQLSQTFFGTRLSPEIGIGVLNNKHRIMAGASWIQPFGANKRESSVDFTAYYRYQQPDFCMSFGAFPRTQLIESLPEVLQYDSLTYFRPNIMGALFQYIGKKGFAELYIDWRQMQTENRREAFIIVGSGRWQPGLFFLGGHAVMNHLARSKNAGPDQSVMDDMVLYPYVGVDFARLTPLSELSLKAGYLLSLERHRGIGVWHHPQGFISELKVQWRFIGVKNTLYAGGEQMPFYDSFGSQLNQGDPFYRSKFYNRTDIYCYIFHNRYVNCKASFNLHATSENISSQQQLTVRFYLDSFSWKSRNDVVKNKEKLKDIL